MVSKLALTIYQVSIYDLKQMTRELSKWGWSILIGYFRIYINKRGSLFISSIPNGLFAHSLTFNYGKIPLIVICNKLTRNNQGGKDILNILAAKIQNNYCY